MHCAFTFTQIAFFNPVSIPSMHKILVNHINTVRCISCREMYKTPPICIDRNLKNLF